MAAHNTSGTSEHEVLLQQLRDKSDLLQSILDTSLIGMSVLRAERNDMGEIDDFRIVIVSQELQRLTGRKDLSGKLYSKKYPGIRQTPLFNLMLQVMETGVAAQIEYPYQLDGFNSWFSSMFVKMGDGLVASNLDITDRKRTEEERFKIFTLLEQTEELAATGSWEYDCLTHQFTWSKGMYRLFKLDTKVHVTLETFLEHAVEDDKTTASLIAGYMVSEQKDFEEMMKVMIDGVEKVMIVKGLVIRNQDNKPLRIIGVNMDNTRQVKLQEEKAAFEQRQKAIEIEQKEQIFKEDLTAQEEERKRIAESLHNGIGQLLYAVKMSLSLVDFNKTSDAAALHQVKQATEQLLVEAIRESRRVSHALTPIILEEFGLKAALEDLCNHPEKEISITYNLEADALRLDKFVEISIYRIVQDLISKLLKHNRKVKGSLIVDHQPQAITLRLIDSFSSLDFEQLMQKSAGMQTVEHKVKLLKGTIELKLTDGTELNIFIPLTI